LPVELACGVAGSARVHLFFGGRGRPWAFRRQPPATRRSEDTKPGLRRLLPPNQSQTGGRPARCPARARRRRPAAEPPALGAMQARGGPSPQAEAQGADPLYPKGGGPASRLACLAQPVVYEEEVDGPVPPVLARLHVRDGCVRAP